MPAKVERQKLMIPNERVWEEWRAICWDHPQETDEVIPPWMASHTHPQWIFAKLDAVGHDFQEHLSAHSAPSVQDVFPERNSDA